MIQLISVKLLQSLKKIDELTGQGGGPPMLMRVHESTAQFGSNNTGQEKGSNEREPNVAQENPLSLNNSTLKNSPEKRDGGDIDRRWLQHIRKIYNALHNMDKHKYLDPKFSVSLYPVLKFFSKKYGPGSVATNISHFSQSQRGGGIISGFNDSYSLSSLLSLDKKGSELSADQKTISLIQQDQQLPVVEQSIEDDDEEFKRQIGISPMKTDQILGERSTSIGLKFSNLKDHSPISVIEPVLKSRHTSRTINGFLLGGTENNVHVRGNDGNQSFISDQQSASIYTDGNFERLKANKSTPRKNTSQKRRIINQNYVTSSNLTTQNNYNLQNAYHTHQTINSSNSYGQAQNQKINHQKKGQKYIRTLIERAQGGIQNNHAQSRNQENYSRQKQNQDINHFESAKTLQIPIIKKIAPDQRRETNISYDYAIADKMSPDTQVARSYYNHDLYSAVESGGQGLHNDNSLVNTIALSNNQPEQDQYSAISVKKISMLNQSDISQQQPAASRENKMFLIKHHSSKKARKPHSKNLRDAYQQQIYDNVYLVPQRRNEGINLQVVNESYQGDDSSRSLQRNYLQNLNELVKIHQEMRGTSYTTVGKQRRR